MDVANVAAMRDARASEALEGREVVREDVGKVMKGTIGFGVVALQVQNDRTSRARSFAASRFPLLWCSPTIGTKMWPFSFKTKIVAFVMI